MPIIDARNRPPTPESTGMFESPWYKKVISSRIAPWEPPISMTTHDMDMYWREFDEAGLAKAVVCHRNTPGVPGAQVPNDHIAEQISRDPDKLIGVAGIDPTNQIHHALTEIERSVKVLGLKGVAMEPGLVRPPMRFNDPRLYPLYEKCQELRVPVFLLDTPFIGEDIEWGHPRTIEQIAKDFRKLNIVVVHGAYPWVMEIIAVGFRYRNVFVMPDVYIFLPNGNLYLEAANNALEDSLVYASAYPVHSMGAMLDAFRKVPMRDEVKEKVFYGNAMRMFGL
ncbi:MAG: amidohydrolase family protein [Dehalococcoidia bacterium]